jgi:hypothetical protein
LRKYQHVDNVVVEELFGLFGSEEKAREGVYVSATISNKKRYYGVLIDQRDLVPSMWFQDQAFPLFEHRLLD